MLTSALADSSLISVMTLVCMSLCLPPAFSPNKKKDRTALRRSLKAADGTLKVLSSQPEILQNRLRVVAY